MTLHETLDHENSSDLPLLTSQYWLWLRTQQYGDSGASVVRCHIDIEGLVDPDKLKWAWTTALTAIESQNVSLHSQNGIPKQRITTRIHPFHVVEGQADPSDLDSLSIGLEPDRALDAVVLEHGASRSRLNIAAHHLANDGFGSFVVCRLAAEIYRTGNSDLLSFQQGGLQRLIDEDNAYLQSDKARKDKEYWSARFEDYTGIDRRTQQRWQPPTHINGLSATLNSIQTETLTTLAREASVAWHVPLFGLMAWQNALRTATNDTVIMVPVARRRSAVAKSVPALRANFLPLRLRMDPQRTIQAFLRYVSAELRDLLVHQQYPSSLVRPLVPVETQGAPLGPSVNVLPSTTRLDFGDSVGELYISEFGPVDDVQMSFARTNDGATLIHCHANASMYSQADVEEYLSNFKDGLLKLLEQKSMSDTVTLDQSFQYGDKELVDHDFFGHLVRNAETHPAKTAVVDSTGSATYRELPHLIEARAHMLRESGVTRGSIVAHLGERTIDTILNLLATWNLGGTYLPIDPVWPADRIRAILTDSSPKVIILSQDTTKQIEAPVPGLPFAPIMTSFKHVDISGHVRPTSTSLSDASLPDIPYIIYTSGSTGAPKGALIGWEGMMNHLNSKRSILADGPLPHNIAATAPLTFDISIWQLTLPLLIGGTVSLVSDATIRDAIGFNRLLREAEISVVELVPGLIGALTEVWRLENRQPTSLRMLFSTGEALPSTLAERVHKDNPDICLVNAYGPTECSDDVTHWQVPRGFQSDRNKVLIGAPISNTSLYILDDRLRAVVPGAVGELYVGGMAVGLGYLRRLTTTSTTFIADPFTDVPGARMYRTGDIARVTPDGDLEYLGRADGQVKINGYRIEIGEVEAHINQLPGVTRCAVLSHGDSSSARLTAYVESQSTARAIAEELSLTLPAYMMPAVIRPMKTLPETKNGKINRIALNREIAIDQPSDARGHDALVDLVAHEISDVLGLEAVDPDVGFLEMGGNSLSGIRLVTALRSQLGLDVGLEDIFRERTARGIATLRHRSEHYQMEINDLDQSGPAPATPGQRRMWLLQKFNPDDFAYNVAIRVDATHKGGYIRSVLHDLINRHPALRTRLIDSPEGLVQDVCDPDSIEWDRYHVIHQVSARPIDQELIGLAASPIPIDSGLPFKIFQFDHAEGTSVLFVLHHAACDGWSLRILGQEIDDAILGAGGTGYVQERRTVADFGRWLSSKQVLETAWYQDQLEYWDNKLADPPAQITWPASALTEFDSRFRSARLHSLLVPQDLHRRIIKAGNSIGATPFVVIQSAISGAIKSIVGVGDDLLIGTAVHGRRDPAFEQSVGFFADTVLLRHRHFMGLSPKQRLRAVRDDLVDSIANSDVPFDDVVRRVRRHDPSFSASNLQVMLSFQQKAQTLSVHTRPLALGAAKFDLSIECEERPDGAGISIGLEYASSTISETTILELSDAIMDEIVRLIDDVPKSIGLDVDNIPTSNECPVGHVKTFVSHIDQGSISCPENIAVEFAGRSITHSHLRMRSEHWAGVLRGAGVLPGDYVALVLPRSIEWVCAFISIMRAGAAVVPLDSNLPQERLEVIFDQLKPRAVVCEPSLKFQQPTSQLLFSPDTLDECKRVSDLPYLIESSIAYVIFTSGSSGTPKGVAVTHANVLAFLTGCSDTTLIAPTNRVVQFGSTGFDATIWELGISLPAGGRLLIPNPDEHSPGPPLAHFVKDMRATHMLIPPSVLRSLPTSLPPTLDLFVGGEAMTQQIVNERAGILRIHNIYGPTEATVAFLVSPPLSPGQEPILGRAIGSSQVFVLDSHLAPVPKGHVGELYVSGPMVAAGYVNDPLRTAASFVACPWDVAGSRMYRTGDLVRVGTGGELVHAGRVDGQVKVRGNRVELLEIQHAIEALPYVDACAVFAVEGTASTQIVAFAKYTDLMPIDSAQVLNRLRDTLPSASIPHWLGSVEDFPLTLNHKVDVTALKHRWLSLQQDSVTTRADNDRTDDSASTITAIEAFQRVLGEGQIDRDTDFIGAGGDSISAVSVVSDLRKNGIYVTPHDVLALRTPGKLAAASDSGTDEKAKSHRGAIALPPVAQWYGTRAPDFVGFTQSALFRIELSLSLGTVSSILSSLPLKHPILASALEDAQLLTLRVPDTLPEPPIEVINLEETSKDLPKNWRRNPIDPRKQSLWRAQIVLEAERPVMIWLQFHHFVIDGVSWRIIVDDLDDLLSNEGEFSAETDQLIPRGLSYRTWSNLLWEHAHDDTTQSALPRWLRMLDPAHGVVDHTHALLTQPPESAMMKQTLVRLGSLVEEPLTFSGEAAESVLVAAFVSALARFNEVPEGPAAKVAIRMEGHGRDVLPGRIDLSQTVGWFTLEHPLVVPVTDDRGIALPPRAILDETRSAYRDLPSDRASYGLLRYNPDRLGSALVGEPRFAFNFLGRLGDDQITNLSIERTVAVDRQHHRPALHDLAVTITIADEGREPVLKVDWEWRPSHFGDDPSSLIERFHDALSDLAQVGLVDSFGEHSQYWNTDLERLVDDLEIDLD